MLHFDFRTDKLAQVLIAKTNVVKVEHHYAELMKYIRLVLRPSTAKEIANSLPQGKLKQNYANFIEFTGSCFFAGTKFCFHSKSPRESRLILQFAPDMDELSKALLESFFEGIPPADDTTIVVEEPMDVDTQELQDDAIDSSLHQKSSKKTGLNVDDEEAPAKKKSRLDQNGFQPRTLRSRSRGQNKPTIKHDPMDYMTDDEEIPESLRVSDEKLAAVVTKTPSRFDRFEHFENTIHLLTYRDIPIEMEDYKCLDRRELVSNFVLDFYLQYLFQEKLPEELRKRVHIYKTTFYTYLATKANFAGWKGEGKAAEKRYERVKDMTDVNIFDKDFIVFPCNTNEHWFLAIACYPRLNGAIYVDNGERVENEEDRLRDMRNATDGRKIKSSCILILDSVQTNPSRKLVALTHIRNFLISEHRAKYQNDFEFDGSTVRTSSPRVSS